MLVALIVLIFAVFQLDSPASLTRRLAVPAGAARASCSPRSSLLLLWRGLSTPRLGTFIADLLPGRPLSESLLDALLLQDKRFAGAAARPDVHRHRHAHLRAGLRRAVRHLRLRVRDSHSVRATRRARWSPGLRDGLSACRHGLAGVRRPTRLAVLACSPCGFWLVYWRRRLRAGARAARGHRRLSRCCSFAAADGDASVEARRSRFKRLGPGRDRRTLGAHLPAQLRAPVSRPRACRAPTDAAFVAAPGTASRCGTKKDCRSPAQIPSPSSPRSRRADCRRTGA